LLEWVEWCKLKSYGSAFGRENEWAGGRRGRFLVCVFEILGSGAVGALG